jgi:ferredoxin
VSAHLGLFSVKIQFMQGHAEHLKAICRRFNIPDFLAPWLDRFFEPAELTLIRILSEKPLRPASLARRMADRPIETFLDRAYRRGIINRLSDGRIDLTDFHARFEIWALFEGWQDIPAEIRRRLNDWEMSFYEAAKRDHIESLKKGTAGANADIAEYLLLTEAEDLIERAPCIYLWPCNCRAMMGQCRQPLYTCLRFSNDRGLGWEISAGRAKEIVHDANRKGLMQVGEVSTTTDGRLTGAICNCCTHCCYPQRLSKRLASEKIWPTSRYVAQHLVEHCSRCGKCVARCPFQAFQFQKTSAGRSRDGKRNIVFNPDPCRGCGLCQTGCPEQAIRMIPLDAENCKPLSVRLGAVKQTVQQPVLPPAPTPPRQGGGPMRN